MKTPIQYLENDKENNEQNLKQMSLRAMNLKNELETLKISIHDTEMENKIIENAIIVLKGAV